MCGRFTQTKSRKEVIEELGNIELPPLFLGRYNIAPSQKIVAIRQDKQDQILESVWGFAPPRSNGLIINARSETIAERPMFKGLLSTNRCLIPADGFYEWKDRQPYYLQQEDRRLFAFAGLWQNGRCVIITRAADENMQGIHDRMPVIFRTGNWADWLNHYHIPGKPVPLTNRPVSRRVNAIRNDAPDLLTASEVQIDLSLFPDED